MRIVFINPEIRPDAKKRMLPVGLGYILTAVKKAGFDFDFIDMDIDSLSLEDLRRALQGRVYDVCAFGCISSGFKFAHGIAKTIREEQPGALIVAGNSVATSMPELLLTRTEVDVAVMGEGDVIIVDLLKALAGGQDHRHVAGIAYLEEGAVRFSPKRTVIPDLDPVGFPDWDIFDLKKYNKYMHLVSRVAPDKNFIAYPLNSARGCPFSCTFCYHVFKGVRYRKYSEKAVIDEIRRLHERFGATCVAFWDELTFADIASVERRVKSLRSLDFNIMWQSPIRGNLFKKKHLPLLREMKEVGCDNLAYSLENASEEILKAINKNLDVSEFIEQSEVIWEAGITPLTSIFFGYPQETPETIQRTLDVCERCRIFPSTGFLLPLPGTEIYDWARQNGNIKDEFEYMMDIGDRQDFHINLTRMTDEEFVSTVENGLKRLAKILGLELASVFKTVTYQKPKNVKVCA